MTDEQYVVQVIGHVESTLVDVAGAPKQASEGAPDAWLHFASAMRPALADLECGQSILVLTWLHRARRDMLRVHPRDDHARPLLGVFSTRSADRPNPIGVHLTRVMAVDGCRIRVEHLEAIDGTPIVDLKPVLAEREES